MLTRRDFLKVAGVSATAAAAMALVGCASGTTTGTTTGNAGTTTGGTTSTGTTTGGTTTGGAATGEKTRIAISCGSAITTVTPFQAASPALGSFQNVLFETLGKFDANNVMQGVVAKKWEMIDDGYKMNVEIYDYVHDTDGNPITVDDIIFSVNTRLGAGLATYGYEKIINTVKVDDYNMTFEFSDNNYGTADFALMFTTVFSQKAYEESEDSFATRAVSTSPYKITNFVNSSSLTFEAVEDYWQTDDLRNHYSQQNVDIIEIICVQDASQVEIALETGTIGYAPEASSASADYFEGKDVVSTKTFMNGHLFHIYFSAAGITADVRLRHAIAYAIDEVALIDAGAGGLGTKTRHISRHLPGYTPKADEGPYYEYDVEKAKALIKECGAEGAHLRMLVVNGGGVVQQMIQAYLREVGLDVEFISMELATYLAVASDPKEYDLCCMVVTGQSNIHYYNIMYDQKQHNGATVNGFVDNDLQAMLEETSTLAGHTEENIIALHEYLCEKLYFYTPYMAGTLHIWRNDSGIVDFADNRGTYSYGSYVYEWN